MSPPVRVIRPHLVPVLVRGRCGLRFNPVDELQQQRVPAWPPVRCAYLLAQRELPDLDQQQHRRCDQIATQR